MLRVSQMLEDLKHRSKDEAVKKLSNYNTFERTELAVHVGATNEDIDSLAKNPTSLYNKLMDKDLI